MSMLCAVCYEPSMLPNVLVVVWIWLDGWLDEWMDGSFFMCYTSIYNLIVGWKKPGANSIFEKRALVFFLLFSCCFMLLLIRLQQLRLYYMTATPDIITACGASSNVTVGAVILTLTLQLFVIHMMYTGLVYTAVRFLLFSFILPVSFFFALFFLSFFHFFSHRYCCCFHCSVCLIRCGWIAQLK